MCEMHILQLLVALQVSKDKRNVMQTILHYSHENNKEILSYYIRA